MVNNNWWGEQETAGYCVNMSHWICLELQYPYTERYNHNVLLYILGMVMEDSWRFILKKNWVHGSGFMIYIKIFIISPTPFNWGINKSFTEWCEPYTSLLDSVYLIKLCLFCHMAKNTSVHCVESYNEHWWQWTTARKTFSAIIVQW